MITVALCEDNDIQRDIMEEMLQEYSRTHTELAVQSFSSGNALLKQVQADRSFFDIYILDIIMPDMNGMEVASTLRLLRDSGKIIFTTASLEYAVASYDVQAFYYMVKPVDAQKLYKILDNAIAAVAESDDVFSVKTKDGDVLLKYRDIMYIEVEDRAMLFHLSDGRTCRSLALRGAFREAISPLIENKQFTACGATKILNLKYVDAVDSETILFRDGTTLYPPRSAYAELRKEWRNYKE